MDPIEFGAFNKLVLPQPERILEKGILYTGCKAIFYGKYKSLKTMLALNLALSLSSGEHWLGLETIDAGCEVFYLQLEVGPELFQQRVRKLGQSFPDRKHPLTLWMEPIVKLDQMDGISALREHLSHYSPKVVMIDPVFKIMSGDISVQRDVVKLLDNIDAIINEFKCAVILVSHPRKGKYEGDDVDDLLGSSLFLDWGESFIKVNREAPQSDRLRVTFDVARHAEEELHPIDLLFHRDTLLFEPKANLKLVAQKG